MKDSAYARRTVRKNAKKEFSALVIFKEWKRFFWMSSPCPYLFKLSFYSKKKSPAATWVEYFNFTFLARKYTFGRIQDVVQAVKW
jgi:hypothetical protein